MSFTYPDKITLTGKIDCSYQYQTEREPIYAYSFRHYPPNNEPEHHLRLYTRNESIGNALTFPNIPEMGQPIRVKVEISTKDAGFEVLEIEILK